jgi:phosphomannomutase
MNDPWKACDIRGVYPQEVSPDLVRRVGASVGTGLPSGARVLMAGDFRTSTPFLRKALAEGLLNSGAHVLDAGEIPTPIAYFAHQQWKTDAVMILTASHNPPDHNGLKLMLGNLPPTRADFERLRRDAERGKFRIQRGTMESIDPVPAYHDWLVARWGPLRGTTAMSVVLDAGSGAWSVLAPRWFEELGFRVHKLFCEVDGTFPHRSPDCARPASLTALMKEVVASGAELGIAWDGDGDRVAFVDGRGSIVSTDEISSLIIQGLVSQEPGSKVVYDIKLSDMVRQTVERSGGRAIMERSGHAFIKRTMIEQDGLFGCEASGHYFFRELRGGDDGLFAALLMTDLLKRGGVRLADLRRSLPPFHVTPDLRIPAEILSFSEITRRLRAAFEGARETAVDGIRLETRLGYVLARESVTEPVVTMRLEGQGAEALQELVEICLKSFPEAAGEISRQTGLVRST